MAESGQYDQATIARRQKIAEAMLGDAMKPQKIEHWAQGLAQLGRAGIGGYLSHQANEEAKASRAAELAPIAKLLGISQPSATPSAIPSRPAETSSEILPAAAPAGPPPSDQASYPPPPAAGPAPTTFRPGIAAPQAPIASAMGSPGDAGAAIAGIESGGKYDKLGPVTKTGDRAYGKYQVMGANIPQWTKTHLGQEMTPDQFLASPEAQDAVFKGQFGQYANKYGPEGAAKAWFAGERGMNNPNARDQLGTTVSAYADKFNRAYQPAQPSPAVVQSMVPPQMPAAQPSGGLLANATPEQKAAIWAGMNASEGSPARTIATAMMQSLISGDKTQTVDLGNKVGILDQRGNIIRTLDKGEPNKGPQFVETGEVDPQTGQPLKGWADPRDKSVAPYRPQGTSPAQPSTVPPVPPGVDPKVWRESQSKRAAEEGMPASGEVTSKLRNEIQGLPSYKNIAQAAPVYKSMTEAAGRDNRAADVNLIYGMAKIMDPGSVVRESEMTVAQAIATLPQQLQAALKSQMTESGRLTPELRQMIMQEARSRILAYQGMFDQDAGMYRGIARDSRMNEAHVLPTFGPFDEFKSPASPPAAKGAVSAPTGVDPKIWQHMTPEERALWK